MVSEGETRRPDPDALLELAGRAGRGKLTVFLGAAPGVGKTYAMLSRARRLRDDGVDIVVGLVETHGRGETHALLDGLEVLPRRAADSESRAYGEFDLDAALARRPAILLVDELAHSNPVGSRHPKRHQDIAELLDTGIDVWTAINIQHVESLSDLVSRIAGVPVRETVPDTVLKQADDVILVDIPPAELIERLKAGRVYLAGNADRALDGFFKPATLTALRELALRRTADRVDDQMVDFLRQTAVEGPWTAGERLLVCIGPDALSERVVRTAARLASGLNAHWLVVSLSRPGEVAGGDGAMLEDTVRLAERLGADTRRLIADDFVDAILRLARRENFTQIVVGHPRHRPLERLFRPRSLSGALSRQAEIAVHLVPGDLLADGSKSHRRKPALQSREWMLTAGIPVATVAGITGAGLSLAALVQLENLSMLYLAAVVVSAIFGGRLAALLAAGLSFLAYDFFFIAPTFALTIAQPQEVLTLVIFTGVALATGTLAARSREQAEHARRQQQRTEQLYDLSRKLAGATGLDSVLTAIATRFEATLGFPTVVLVPAETGELDLSAAWPPDQSLDTAEMTAARWSQSKAEPAGHMTGTLPETRYLFRPIRSTHRTLGVVGLLMPKDHGALSAAEADTIGAFLEQAAIALDRALLVREAARASLALEGERLQSALLSSLSHDLRTPLASITGAASTLRELGDRIDPETRSDLLQSIGEEAGRLTRFVENLFDITRVETGSLKPKSLPIDLGDAIAGAVSRARAIHPDIAVEVSLAQDLAPALGDPTLLEQVLVNLLDNARKYAGTAAIAVFARTVDGKAQVSITDQGRGIPVEDLERIFDKFYRRAKGDGRPAGTGLGLSIARGYILAMGGTIRAESPATKRRGTRFVISLPLADKGV